MKKFGKIAACIAICAAAALGAACLASCRGKDEATVAGEYHYIAYGTEYGVRVYVDVEGDTIKSVTVAGHDYEEVTSGWEGEESYRSQLQDILAEYSGKSISYVLSIEVAVSEGGEPKIADEDGFVSLGDNDEFLISGSTLSSGRLMLAVQDALKKL